MRREEQSVSAVGQAYKAAELMGRTRDEHRGLLVVILVQANAS
jgi:hypothetical protein